MILLIMLLGYVLLALPAMYVNERARIRLHKMCEHCAGDDCYMYNHDYKFYWLPPLGYAAAWPFYACISIYCVFKIMVVGLNNRGHSVFDKIADAAQRDAEGKKMHTLVEGKGEND